MSRIALIVGIDDYPNAPLAGCVNDATRMYGLLARNYDESPNFDSRLLISKSSLVSRSVLKEATCDLFKRPADAALFYFSGHGTVNNLGGYLVTQDAKQYDEGMAMADVLSLASNSPAGERVIILDCCHSGALGQLPVIDNLTAILKEGVSVLSASRASEVSIEVDGGGLFTSLICAALGGGASDVCGKVTVASVYAYVDQALGGWEQRPLFKSHVSRLVSLRACPPAVDPAILRLLPKYFPSPHEAHCLDPSYERTAQPSNPGHEAIFEHLQKLRDARLVVPIGEEHMYYAAMNSKSCKLTALGAYYWHLADSGKI